MSKALAYTVLPGDTLSAIAAGLNAAAGVSVAAIEAANPDIAPATMQVGARLAIPARQGGTALTYTVHSGDTFSGIAAGLADCAGVTWQDIVAANPGLDPATLKIGQVIAIPATGTVIPVPDPLGPTPDAAAIGIWHWTWSASCTPPAGCNLGIAFSGWTDPAKAIADSAKVRDGLPGAKYIAIGGGNENGAFDAASLQSVTAAIQAGQFHGWDGIAYDIEGGSGGLATLFTQSFAAAKAAGLKVLVTVSHSQPYDIPDAATLMKNFIADANIDYLSPQLYTTGKETGNDYSAIGTPWKAYAAAHAIVVPSIVSAAMWSDAKAYFAGQGVTLGGFVQWSQS